LKRASTRAWQLSRGLASHISAELVQQVQDLQEALQKLVQYDADEPVWLAGVP
jgi:hypothetical protein